MLSVATNACLLLLPRMARVIASSGRRQGGRSPALSAALINCCAFPAQLALAATLINHALIAGGGNRHYHDVKKDAQPVVLAPSFLLWLILHPANLQERAELRRDYEDVKRDADSQRARAERARQRLEEAEQDRCARLGVCCCLI